MSRTEERNPKTMNIDKMSTLEMLAVINEENMNSVKAVERASADIAKAVDAAAAALEAGGRIIYIGAGTSGRLAVVDASECPPTFGVDYNTVRAVIAGGEKAIVHASENVEDQADTGRNDFLAIEPTCKDFVMGISASGNAEYVVAAMMEAKRLGCVTVSLSCNPTCKIADVADIAIFTDTGAEVITGSTRMKAGNAQKFVLNMISTCAMVKTGKVCENLMINLRPTNKKLKQRMIGIVTDLCGADADTALKLLEENDFDIRSAVAAYKQ